MAMEGRSCSYLLFILVLAAGVAGCGTMQNGRGWGQDATLSPGWARLGRAALDAASTPETWGPAAGALAFQAGRADRKTAEWAARETPVYGSRERADRMSYELRDAAGAIWVASGIAAPSGDAPGEWAVAKAEGFGVQTGAGILMREAVGYLKTETDRTRPNGVDKGSFPSAHASGAALYTTFASRNIETMSWPSGATLASEASLGALTVVTAWARVEAGQHYPSDVLGGIALGHFFGSFFTEAFMGVDSRDHALLLFEPFREGAVALLRLTF